MDQLVGDELSGSRYPSNLLDVVLRAARSPDRLANLAMDEGMGR